MVNFFEHIVSTIVTRIYLGLLLLLCAESNVWAQTENSEYTPTGTLPVIYITTDSMKPIESKTEYLPATYYIDNMGHSELPSLGSSEEPLPLEIRGRGNSTWTKPKKPYKLKLGKKTDLFGNGKNKHYVLLAGYEGRGFLKDATCFEVARRIGFDFVPRSTPVEVVLNDDYIGLYLLCEQVRVDNNRVNITEQEDGDTIPENITGGWLIEIDRNPDDNQFEITQANGEKMKFVVHSPDSLSPQQWDYITNYVQKTDSAVFSHNPYSVKWQEFIDFNSLVRFYVMNEVVGNIEAFSGSCYMHKERGDSTKFIFGPVWDFGSSFGNSSTWHFIYEPPYFYAQNKWIKQLARFASFQQRVRALWHRIYPKLFLDMPDWITAYTRKIRAAAIQDSNRWPESPSEGQNLRHQSDLMKSILATKTAWLDEQWQTYNLPGDVNVDESVNVSDVTALVNMILGVVEKNEIAADLNGDGKVNVSDLTALINIILGIH